MSQQFIHTKGDIANDVFETKQHKDKSGQVIKDAKDYKVRTFSKYVPGYEPCKECGQHPAFAYDSAKPNEVKVITCEHIQKGGQLKDEFKKVKP